MCKLAYHMMVHPGERERGGGYFSRHKMNINCPHAWLTTYAHTYQGLVGTNN